MEEPQSRQHPSAKADAANNAGPPAPDTIASVDRAEETRFSRPPTEAQKTPPHESSAEAPNEAPPVQIIRQYELVDLVRAYDESADEDLLNRAYVFAMKAHGGQTRKSGDPYFSHPLAVAQILTELRADPATVVTALLHDVVEDTETTVDEISALFGREIGMLVDGVTKLSQIEHQGEASKQAENFRKLVVAMANDVRVLLVKLADRLHNMRTLHFHPKPEKRRRIALETMEIFAPLAGRIGVHRIREELEDLSFKEINPEAFATIDNRLCALQEGVVKDVVAIATAFRDLLSDAGVDAEVFAREKRPYSIWRKMAAKNVSFEELADIYAFRFMTTSVEDCYRALGVVHTNWRIIPDEFDDYVSSPKPNGYQSIHTAVIGPPRPDGGRQRIEVQIRTVEMHDAAERGVAAHWQYKDPNAGAGEGRSIEIRPALKHDPYETPRRLVEMFQAGENADEALAYAKLELFQDQVFAFTPKGRVIALPKSASALDFAYAVHTDIGDACIGVKINGRTRPLRTPLKNGDVVEVLRSENSPPPAEWETMVITGRARSAIRRRIKRMERAEQIELGRRLAENVFNETQLDFSAQVVRAALERLGEDSVDNVLAKIGRAELTVNTLIEAVFPGADHELSGELQVGDAQPFRPRRAIIGLPANGVVRMARCCTPINGERIVGIRDATGDLVDVHAIYCDRLATEDPPQSCWIDLRWRDDVDAIARTIIVLTIKNEIGVLSEVAGVIARYGVSILNIRITGGAGDFQTLAIDVEISGTRALAQMMAGLRSLSTVLSAVRNEGKNNENG
ncbi:MAG: bifunctional (p)ppGpp synthetase/guanosine-3',5'-bis(diphosphate) 3'-pyrophosphohydrolase [Pseudomonadota bacterium]